MHFGNVYAALMSWLSIKSKGGQWLLRIEDLDPQRCRMEYALQVEDDLRWLGLRWDMGGTAQPELIQSNRSHIYERYLDILKDKNLVYPCYCTRADILATQAPHESDGRVVYKGTCRPKGIASPATLSHIEGTTGQHINIDNKDNNKPAALRMYVPSRTISFTDGHYGMQSINLAEHCGDFILRRKDGAWAYQLAVVVDDAQMGVTEVVRGRDLLLSVPQQLYLYETLGLDAPSFAHFPLICNENHQRLSKRDHSLDMGELRKSYTPEQLIGHIAHIAGLLDKPTPITPEELIPLFSWDKVPTEDIVAPPNLPQGRLGGVSYSQ